MEGPRKASKDEQGIIPNAFQHIFDYIMCNDSTAKFLVRCSYLEI